MVASEGRVRAAQTWLSYWAKTKKKTCGSGVGRGEARAPPYGRRDATRLPQPFIPCSSVGRAWFSFLPKDAAGREEGGSLASLFTHARVYVAPAPRRLARRSPLS